METKTTLEQMFDDVREACDSAHLVAFDGCHKIYLAMDEIEAAWFMDRDDYTVVRDTPSAMFNQLKKWYEKSCGLRFINAVEHNELDPNEGYTQLVPQGAEDDDIDEDEEDYS